VTRADKTSYTAIPPKNGATGMTGKPFRLHLAAVLLLNLAVSFGSAAAADLTPDQILALMRQYRIALENTQYLAACDLAKVARAVQAV